MARLEILQASLAKKQAAFEAAIQAHFDAVKQANGQPINDKRNGAATMRAWDKQNYAIRKLQDGIEVTKNAIEREKSKIANAASFAIPAYLQPFLDNGTITQWRKFPNRFFVVGVEKARIVLLDDNKINYSHYTTELPDEQREIFKSVILKIRAARDFYEKK